MNWQEKKRRAAARAKRLADGVTAMQAIVFVGFAVTMLAAMLTGNDALAFAAIPAVGVVTIAGQEFKVPHGMTESDVGSCKRLAENNSDEGLHQVIEHHAKVVAENEGKPSMRTSVEQSRLVVAINAAELDRRMSQSAGVVVGGHGEGRPRPAPKVESGYQSIFEGARIEGTDKRIHVIRGDEQVDHGFEDESEYGIGDIVHAMATGGGSAAVREALNTGSDASGGVMFSPQKSGRFLDHLRPRSVAFRAGVGQVRMDQPWIRVLIQDSDPTGHWRAEGAAVDPSAPTFDKYEVRPKFLGCVVVVTQEQLEGATNTRGIVEAAIAASLASQVDAAILSGSGSDNMPKGIRNWDNVLTHDMSGEANYGMISAPVGEILEENFFGDASDLSWIRHPRDAKVFNDLTDTTGQPLQPNPWAAAVKKYTSTQMPVNLGDDTDRGSHIVGYMPACTAFIHQGLRIEMLREGTVVNQALTAQHYLGSEWKYAFRASLRMDVVVERPTWFSVANDFDHDYTEASE